MVPKMQVRRNFQTEKQKKKNLGGGSGSPKRQFRRQVRRY